jgi:signal transduction histidine kinase
VQVAGDDVLLVVTDDGCGFGADVVAGVGLTSMRERAAELGGTLVVETAPGTGTEVRAVLPVQRR